jgi:hypothetical protein
VRYRLKVAGSRRLRVTSSIGATDGDGVSSARGRHRRTAGPRRGRPARPPHEGRAGARPRGHPGRAPSRSVRRHVPAHHGPRHPPPHRRCRGQRAPAERRRPPHGDRDPGTRRQQVHGPRPRAVARGRLAEATAGELDRSTRHRELRRPSGFDDELRVVLTGASGTWGALTLLREARRPRFTPAETQAHGVARRAAGRRRPPRHPARGRGRPTPAPGCWCWHPTTPSLPPTRPRSAGSTSWERRRPGVFRSCCAAWPSGLGRSRRASGPTGPVPGHGSGPGRQVGRSCGARCWATGRTPRSPCSWRLRARPSSPAHRRRLRYSPTASAGSPNWWRRGTPRTRSAPGCTSRPTPSRTI